MAAGNFFWGAGGQKLTQEQIDSQRKILAALAQRGDPAFNNAGWLGAIGRGLEGAYEGWQDSKLRAEQEDLNQHNKGLGIDLARLLSGDTTIPAASTSAVAQELAGSSPAPVVAEGEIADYIRQSATARGIDPNIALRVAMSEGGLRDPVRQSDYVKNGVREASYGPFQLYMGGGLGNKALEAGIDPRDPNQWKQGVDFALDQAAKGGWSPWYGAAKVGIGNRTGLDNARAIGFAPQSASPAAAAIESAAPASGYVDPVVSAPNAAPSSVASALLAPETFDNGRFGNPAPEIYSAPGDFAPPLPAATSIAPAPSVAAPQMPSASAPSLNPEIIRILSDPRANESTRNVAQLLLQQQQARQNAALEQQTWIDRQNYERQMQASDPLRQAQIAKAQREAANGGETFFGNTVPVQNADGTISYGQIGNQGTFKPIQLPEGQSFAPPTRTVDTGTEIITTDSYGNELYRTPKQNRQAAAQTAQGSAEGKGAAETSSEYNSITSKMPGLYGVIDRLSTLADQATYTMAGRALDAVNSQLGLEPRDAAVARAEYTAIVDNQILPLLRDTFGAQFTNEEGLRLARTLGDADKTPTEKQALLKAFIAQKERDIEALRTRTGQPAPTQSSAPKTGSRLKFNPQTGDLE